MYDHKDEFEYKIITFSLINKFEEAVNDLLGKGWELHGSLCVNITPASMAGVMSEARYTQAFLKVKV